MRAWEKNIRKVVPYTAGEQPKDQNVIKLNTNENPYPPSPKVLEKLKNMDYTLFRKYPDPNIEKLAQALGDYYKVEKQNVFVGVGSDDVLAIAFMTFFHGSEPILFPDITYSFYKVWADLFQIPYECQSLDEEFRIKKEDYYKPNGGIVIANPNAPTSIYESLDSIRDILKANQESVVIIDEAYIDFGGESAVELIDEFDNLLVVQTFSKSRSMAGIRIGYALGNEKLIQFMNHVKHSFNSYTLNQTSIELGTEALLDKAYFKESINKIIETREDTMKKLKELGFTLFDSSTNFIFATHKKLAAKEIYEKLRDEHIYIRYFNLPRIDEYIRISIGKAEEMDILIQKLRELGCN